MPVFVFLFFFFESFRTAKACSWRHSYVSQAEDQDDAKVAPLASRGAIATSSSSTSTSSSSALPRVSSPRAQAPSPPPKELRKSGASSPRSLPEPVALPAPVPVASPRSIEPIPVGSVSPRGAVPVKLASPRQPPVKLGDRRGVSGPATLISSKSPPPVIKNLNFDEIKNLPNSLEDSFF